MDDIDRPPLGNPPRSVSEALMLKEMDIDWEDLDGAIQFMEEIRLPLAMNVDDSGGNPYEQEALNRVIDILSVLHKVRDRGMEHGFIEPKTWEGGGDA